MSDHTEMTNEQIKAAALKKYNKDQTQLPESEKNHDFPTEFVELASKGKLYPEGHPLASGEIEMKYMTAADEDILATQSYIRKGIVFDKLFEALIVTSVDFNDLLLADKDSIMVATRILSGYGATYDVPLPGLKDKYPIDLTKIEDKTLHEVIETAFGNSFVFTLPTQKVELSFHLMTQRDKLELNQKLELLEMNSKTKAESREVTTRLIQMIDAIDGNSDPIYITKFVHSMLAGDSRKFREYVAKITPGINTRIVYRDDDGTLREEDYPLGVDFLYPGA